MFFGPQTECQGYFEQMRFFVPPRMNPADYFIDLITKDVRTEEQEQQSIERVKMLVDNWIHFTSDNADIQRETDSQIATRESPIIAREPPSLPGESSQTIAESFPMQSKRLSHFKATLVLLERETKNTHRNLPFQLFRILQVSSFTVILGLAFLQMKYTQRGIQNRLGILFFIAINVVFTTANPYLLQFPEDKERIQRERATDNYSGWSAFIAKMLSAWPALLLVNFAYLTGLYWMLGLQGTAGHYFTYVAILLTLVIFSQVFALTVGAASPSFEVANIIAPTLLILFVIFGGNFLNPLTIPGYLIWIYWISPVQFAYKAIAQNEFVGLQFSCGGGLQNEICFRTGGEVLNFYYLYYPSLWTCYLILLGMTVGFAVMGMIILELKTATHILK